MILNVGGIGFLVVAGGTSGLGWGMDPGGAVAGRGVFF